MYSFQPLTDYSDAHVGFYIIFLILGLAFGFVLAIWKDDQIENHTMVMWFVIFGILGYMAHENSYTPHHPLNEPHIGNFVGYQPEGYRERSGKTTVDRHFVYVIYNIDGVDVLFPAETGIAYPKRATVYKN